MPMMEKRSINRNIKIPPKIGPNMRYPIVAPNNNFIFILHKKYISKRNKYQGVK